MVHDEVKKKCKKPVVQADGCGELLFKKICCNTMLLNIVHDAMILKFHEGAPFDKNVYSYLAL